MRKGSFAIDLVLRRLLEKGLAPAGAFETPSDKIYLRTTGDFDSVDAVRDELRRLGYLDSSLDRFVLQGASGATPLAAVQPPLERIRAELEQRDWAAVAGGLRVTVSIGVTAFHRGETLEQVLSRADDALYEAKRLGRDRIVTRD